MTTPNYFWLVVLWDRHCDDTYRLCTSLAQAQHVADLLMESWDLVDSSKWVRDNPYEADDTNSSQGQYVYTHSTYDDGPRLHIQRLFVERVVVP